MFWSPLDSAVIEFVTNESSGCIFEDPFNIIYVVKIVKRHTIERETMIRCIQQPVWNILMSKYSLQSKYYWFSSSISYMRKKCNKVVWNNMQPWQVVVLHSESFTRLTWGIIVRSKSKASIKICVGPNQKLVSKSGYLHPMIIN